MLVFFNERPKVAESSRISCNNADTMNTQVTTLLLFSLWAQPASLILCTRALVASFASFVNIECSSFFHRYVTALLFLSVDKLSRIPVDSSPLARVLRRYKVSNIKSFCGASIFDLCHRNLVTLPSVSRARASVLEYLGAPSQELVEDKSQIKEFDITSNCSFQKAGHSFSEEDEDSSSKEIVTVLANESVQLSFVEDLLHEAGITQSLPTNYASLMDMYGRYVCISAVFFCSPMMFDQSRFIWPCRCIIVLVL